MLGFLATESGRRCRHGCTRRRMRNYAMTTPSALNGPVNPQNKHACFAFGARRGQLINDRALISFEPFATHTNSMTHTKNETKCLAPFFAGPGPLRCIARFGPYLGVCVYVCVFYKPLSRRLCRGHLQHDTRNPFLSGALRFTTNRAHIAQHTANELIPIEW